MPMECWHVFPRAICSNNLQGILDNAWYRTLAQQDFREPSEGSAVRLYVDASCCLKTGGRLHGDAILTAKYVRVSGAACCQRPPRFRHRRFLVRRAGAWTLGANACTIGVIRIRFWAHYSKEPPNSIGNCLGPYIRTPFAARRANEKCCNVKVRALRHGLDFRMDELDERPACCGGGGWGLLPTPYRSFRKLGVPYLGSL